MGIFDFWRKRGGVNSAGFFDSPPQEAKNRYLASIAGSKGLMALRVSGFARNANKDRHLVHARFIGRRKADGGVEFVSATEQQANDWGIMVNAIEKSAGPFKKTVLKSGGTIVISADVNVQSGAGLLDQVKAKVDSFLQRYFTRSTKVEDTIETVEKGLRTPEMPEEDRVIPAYSMGNLFQGRYYGKNPRTGKMTLFNEKSFVVEIRGVDTEILDNVADAIRIAFNQYQVLVINDNDNLVYMVEEDDKKAAPQAA